MLILEKSPPNDTGQGVRITMKYDWEDKLEKNFDFEGCNKILNETHQTYNYRSEAKLAIMGVIVANTEDNEACVCVNPQFDKKKNVSVGDLWLDAGGDVEAQRQKAMGYDN